MSLLAPLTANAAPIAVPLTTLGPPSTNGNLSNGVGWSVAVTGTATTGGWRIDNLAPPVIEYYDWIPTEGNQVWTFTTPVNLSFSVSGLQGPNEGVILPAGTVCDASGADAVAYGITFDPVTFTLVHAGPGNPDRAVQALAIPCTLDKVTELKLDATGLNQVLSRGLYSLSVAPATLKAQFSGLPSTIKPGETVHGSLTCSNAGSGQTPPRTGPNALNVTCDPVIASGGGTLNNIQCTPPVPLAVLKDGESIVCTFDLTAPNTSTVNMELIGTTTADGLFAATATRSPGRMTDTVWLRSAGNGTAVPTLGEWSLALLALGLLGMAGLGLKRRG